jgi:hypothetical protein
MDREGGANMAHNKCVMNGVVHGRTIELETEPGLPDGQAVSVTVEAVEPVDEAKRQEFLKHSNAPPAAGKMMIQKAWSDISNGIASSEKSVDLRFLISEIIIVYSASIGYNILSANGHLPGGTST